jgi:transposase-like protein
MKKQVIYCPSCGSDKIKIKGSDRAVSGKPRYRCPDCQHRTTAPLEDKPEAAPVFNTKLPTSKVYVVTCAQNATKPHAGFLQSLRVYAKRNHAKLLIIPIRYRNPTSRMVRTAEQWWHKDVLEHLFAGRGDINDNLCILGDIKIRPTAEDPISGLHGISGQRSAIIGHPKIALQTVATPSHRMPKVIVTTGAVTIENYTDSKAGKKGEFHHSLGAVIVEVRDDEKFNIRHVSAQRDGSFIDWDTHYSRHGARPAKPAEALVMGDAHLTFMDPDVRTGTFGIGGVIDKLKPRQLVWHDTLDSYSVSPHHYKHPILQVVKRKAGLDDGMKEIKDTVNSMVSLTHPWPKMRNIVVPSNHDEHLSRWIADRDWRMDPQNAEFYLETALAMVRGAEMGEGRAHIPDPFKWWAGKLMRPQHKRRFLFLSRGASYEIADIEIGYHGDKGPGGSRGSAMQYRNIGSKTIIGHSHTPKIVDGCYQVGTSSRLALDYNVGPPQTWLHCHCVVYANGKRSLLIMVNGSAKT